MKKTPILLVALLYVGGVSAQSYRSESIAEHEFKNTVSWSLPHLVVGDVLHLSYENAVSDRVSVGANVEAYTGIVFDLSDGSLTGLSIDPTVKWYFDGRAANYGWYAQGQLILGYFAEKTVMTTGSGWTRASGFGDYQTTDLSAFQYGAGVRMGYLLGWPSPSHWAVDFSLGYNFRAFTKGLKRDELLGNLRLAADIAAVKIVYRF